MEPNREAAKLLPFGDIFGGGFSENFARDFVVRSKCVLGKGEKRQWSRRIPKRFKIAKPDTFKKTQGAHRPWYGITGSE